MIGPGMSASELATRPLPVNGHSIAASAVDAEPRLEPRTGERLALGSDMIDELKQKLQAEVERLNHEINFVLPKEIERARAHGDLRENSEYKAALERQQFVTSRLSHLRLRLSKLSGVRESDIPRDRVGFGSRVTVQDLDTKKKETYALTLGEFIEGDDDPDELPVSMASPLGKSLLGTKVGEAVTIALPVGKRRLKVVELETVHDLAK